MATIKKDNSVNPYLIDEGTYTAVVTAVEEKEARSKYLEWTFKILNPTLDGEDIEGERSVRGSTPILLQDESKLDKWARACGVDTDDGDSFDTEDLIGKKVTVFVIQEQGSGKHAGKTFCKVDKLVRSKKAKPQVEDEEPVAKPKPKAKPVEEEPAPKARSKVADDEEEPVAKPKPKAKPTENEEEPAVAPKPKAKPVEETDDDFDFSE